MFVKIKTEYLNSPLEADMIYKIVNMNEVTGRCYIEPIETSLAIVPQELVSLEMLEEIAY